MIFLSTHASAAVILSGNLATITAGTETASGNTWLAGSFGTGIDVLTSPIATLLVSSAATTDSVELSLYSDGGLEPGNQLATFTSPPSLSTSLSPAVFNASGLHVAANSTYWIVLRSLNGSVDWGWTSDNSGTGVGFQHTWAISSDAGAVWFSDDTFPTQFTISGEAATSAVPEPGSLAMLAGSMTAAWAVRQHRRRMQRKEIVADDRQ